MSDSLPENSFSGVLRVLKLITGEEIIGLVNEALPEKITIKLPAKLEFYMGRAENNESVEYVKLTNFLSSFQGFECSISKNAIIYIGQPALDLEKMYEIYFMAMQNDPKSVVSSLPPDGIHPENGLQLLNDLFNNEDFVEFVNELIENFEGIEIINELDDEDEYESESSIMPQVEEDPEPQPRKRKKKRIKPEGNKLPYKPDSPPEDPESWSDNPQDYM